MCVRDELEFGYKVKIPGLEEKLEAEGRKDEVRWGRRGHSPCRLVVGGLIALAREREIRERESE